MAGRWPMTRELAPFDTVDIHFHLAEAGLAVQRLLVEGLHAALADEARRPVAACIEINEVLLGNAAHRTDGMCEQRVERIVANAFGTDHDATQPVAVDLDDGALRRRNRRLHGDLFERPPLTSDALLEGRPFVGRKAHQRVDLGKRPVEILSVFGDDGDGQNRLVVGQQLAVGVVDQTPHRHHGDGLATVVVRLRPVLFVLHDHQPDQAGTEQAEQARHDHEHHECPFRERLPDLLRIHRLRRLGNPRHRPTTGLTRRSLRARHAA